MFGLHGLTNPGQDPGLNTTGGPMYYHFVGQFTVSELTDRYRYDAFGGIFTGITAPYNSVGYTGHHYDDKSGLVDMKARWYDPSAGRFLTPDTYPGTMMEPFTQHRYAYVGNNPINMWDPTGNVPEWVRSRSNNIDYYGDGADSWWYKNVDVSKL
jgi:RHS repeat-associated protein